MGSSWALACSITLLSACASNKPPPDQIFLMPAPVVYTEGQIDPFSENRLRGSPWVSSDVLLTLLYDLEPEKRGLVRVPDSPVWVFPDDYIARLRRALVEVDPSLAAR
jgi:hypothetical protein